MIDLRALSNFLGTFLMALGICMCVPALIDLHYDSLDWIVFLKSGALTFFVGLALCFPFRMPVNDLNLRESFLLTLLAWMVLTLFSAVPFLLSHVALTPTDAFFESASGWTTTGSMVFQHLETLPRCILVIAIALTPIRGIGGMYLFRAESSDTSEKLIPRIKKLAIAIMGIYTALTSACAHVLPLRDDAL